MSVKVSELRIVQVDAEQAGSTCPAAHRSWDELFARQAGIANPFCAPEWVAGWYAAFTTPDQRRLFEIWQGDELVGVAPFYRSRVGSGPLAVGHRLQLVGAGQGGALLELPQILAAPGQERAVLRAVVAQTVGEGDDADWAEVAVPTGVGWFEPEWAVSSSPVSFYRQHASRACVMLPLAEGWEETRSTLKRNVKESLRRSRNRLAKCGRDSAVVVRRDDLDRACVDGFLDLHQQRSAHAARVRHADAFAEATRRDLLRNLLPELGRRGRASVYELRIEGDVVAAQLVLHAPGLSYIHSSGFRSDVWELGPVTHLQGEAIRDAADRGESWINFSPGPNVAKLRWSEQVDVHTDFAYGRGRKSLRWRYGLFSAAQSVAQVRHAVAVARVPGPG